MVVAKNGVDYKRTKAVYLFYKYLVNGLLVFIAYKNSAYFIIGKSYSGEIPFNGTMGFIFIKKALSFLC